MPKLVEFHEEALAEVEAAFDWYLSKSERVATEFLEELDRAIEMIILSPERWLSATKGTRRYLLRRFPFAVVYRELPSVIQIVAVAHGRRRPGYWKKRV